MKLTGYWGISASPIPTCALFEKNWVRRSSNLAGFGKAPSTDQTGNLFVAEVFNGRAEVPAQKGCRSCETCGPADASGVERLIRLGKAYETSLWQLSMVSFRDPLMQRRVGSAKNVSEKVLDSRTVLFINQRRKPTKISTATKSIPAFPLHENRRSKRIVLKKGASLVVNLDRIPKRLPCLIVDSSPEGFRLMW